jgi:MSHA biogenesis protein MshI
LFSLKASNNKQISSGIVISEQGIAFALIAHQPTPSLLYADFIACSHAEQHEVLASLCKQHGLTKYPCNLVLLPNDYQLIQIEQPNVKANELNSALRWRIKDLIDFDIEEAVIDALLPPQQAGNQHNCEVIVANQDTIQHYASLLQQAKIQLNSIDITELAIRNIAARLSEPASSMAVLSLWPDMAKISLYLDNDLFLSRSSSIGLTTLTHLQQEDDAAMIILDSLALEIQRTFDYFDSHSGQGQGAINNLYILSNGICPAKLSSLITQKTDIPCQQISLDLFLQHNDASVADSENTMIAIGGALRVDGS